MKSKKLLSLVIIMLAVFCFALLPTKPISASAEVTDIVRVSGYEYNLENLLSQAGIDSVAGKTVKYRLTALDDGTAVTENDEKYSEATKKVVTSTVEFLRLGEYTFEVLSGETVESTFKVKTTAYEKIDETSMRYDLTAEKLSAMQKAVEDHASTLKVKDSFSFTNSSVLTSLEKLIVSDYFPYSALTKNYYYSTPQSTSYTLTTNSKFKLTAPGTYSFYVLLQDELKNVMSVEDLVMGDDGWYAKDADDKPTGDLLIPVFSFTVDKIVAPEITVSASEAGFLNLEYSVDAFTVVSDDYKAEYKLYYSDKEFDKDDEAYESDSDYIKDIEEHASDVTKDLFDEEELSFTPDKKGYYYVWIRAVDSANMAEEAMSKAISVQREFTTVKVEKEFFKNNVVAIVFFSIALVCAIALVILLCIKPKDYNVELETKKNVK